MVSVGSVVTLDVQARRPSTKAAVPENAAQGEV
jgi:hypothetical protein